MNIRRATINDARFLFGLRNEPEVRLASWRHDLVEFTDHRKWFSVVLSDNSKTLYLVEDENGVAVGQVRYDRRNDGNFEVNIAISKGHSGKGYGTQALVKTAEVFFTEFTHPEKIIAHIKPDNFASLKIFTKAGYSDPVLVNYEGHDCLEMVLYRAN